MPGVSLGIGDHHPVGLLAESRPQGVNFGCGAAAPSRCVGFVRNKDGLRGDHVARDSKPVFGLAHQLLHDFADVLHVQPGAVKCAVGCLGG